MAKRKRESRAPDQAVTSGPAAEEKRAKKARLEGGSSLPHKSMSRKADAKQPVKAPTAAADLTAPLTTPATVENVAEQAQRERKERKKARRAAARGVDPPAPAPAPVQEQPAAMTAVVAKPSKRDTLRKEQKRQEKKARRSAEKAEKAEAFGDAALDREVEMLDQRAIQQQLDAELQSTTMKVNEPARSSWVMSGPSAGRSVQCDPVFATEPRSGEQVLIAATAREVQVLNLATSLMVRSCPVPGGRSIVAFDHDTVADSVDVLCDDGAVFSWDWNQESNHINVVKTPHDIKAIARLRASDGKSVPVYLCTSGSTSSIHVNGKPLYAAGSRLTFVQVAGDGEFIIAYGGNCVVLGRKKDSAQPSNEYIWVEVPMTMSIICLDARLTHIDTSSKKTRARLSLAIGHTDGKIHLYDDTASLFTQKPQTTLSAPRILHWHREAVSAIKFSKDGNYLITGAKETVLVLWQLQTGKKQFLPHLTSEIERIVVSPAGDRYAVQMGDNSIMVLSTSELRPVANFAGLQLAAPSTSSRSAQEERKAVAATLHPQHPNQLLLTVPATQPKQATEAAGARSFLQMYDLRTQRHVARQALTRNNVTDFNLGPQRTAIASPDVGLLTVSQDGQWMATVDEWMPPASDVEYLANGTGHDVEGGVLEEMRKRREVYLKIWKFDKKQELWTLITRVNTPHTRPGNGIQGAGRVLALAASPTSNSFATIGEDSKVKFWKPRTKVRHGVALTTGEGEEVVEWVCKKTVELPSTAATAEIGEMEVERVDSPLEGDIGEGARAAMREACLAHSEDGSLLAVSQTFTGAEEGDLVHLIDVGTGTIKSAKSDIATDPTHCLAFLDRYLIAVSQCAVHLWDLVTDTLHRQYHLPDGETVPVLAVNAVDGSFAVAVGNKISVYRAEEKKAVYMDECESETVAVLAQRESRSYTILLEDATVRTLSSIAVRRALPTTLSTTTELSTVPPATAMRTDATDTGDETTDILALPPSGGVTAERRVLDDVEDDRPVVRPEQLASIFDVGQGVAMMPVREMFEAVVGIFGRRPHAFVSVEGAA